MTETNPVSTAKTALAEQYHARLVQLAAEATESDRQAVAAIIAKAQTGVREAETVKVTPGMAAIIFLDHNHHNRDWSAPKTRDFTQQMIAGQWRWNGASWVWYEGEHGLGDAQHRAAALALSGQTMNIVMVYGLARADIVTVDVGRRRSPAQAATMEGVAEAGAKQQIIRAFNAYEARRLEQKSDEMRISDSTLRDLIISNNKRLTDALSIGEASIKDIVRPLLKPIDAAKLAYLMLSAHVPWPAVNVVERLRTLQAGQAQGEKDPIFQAAEMISDASKHKKGKDKLSETSRCGLAIHAFGLVERGIHAVRQQDLKAATKKLPAPDFPEEVLQQEAA